MGNDEQKQLALKAFKEIKEGLDILNQRTNAVLAMVNVLSASLISKGILDYDQYEKDLKKEIADFNLVGENNGQ